MSACDLPDKVWVKILGHLNVRSLLNASETCSRFNNVIGTSEKLMKMIRLNIEIPVDYLMKEIHHKQNKLKGYRQIQDLKENLLMSHRLYRNFGLSYLGRCRGSSVPLDTIMTKILMEICEIFQLLCKNVIDFKIQYCNFDTEVFMEIMSEIRNVEKITIEDSEIYVNDFPKKNLSEITLSKLRNIHFIDVGKFSISFGNFRGITYSNHRECIQNENFLKNLLLKQKHLKILHIECHEIFGQYFPKTEFSLESLSLKCDKWKNMDKAESFFKKQINLKDISLKLNDNGARLNSRYNDILKHIFSLNHNLSTINLEIKFKMENATFLDGICLPNVTSLSFKSTEKNSALFVALIKMCPKIKKLAFRSDKEAIDDEAVNTLVDLESLTIDSEGELMQDIICAGRLINFSLHSFEEDEDSKIFLSNHQSIEHLIISHKIVSRVLCKHIVNYLPNLRSFEFDELEGSYESLQMLLKLKNLRSLKSKSFKLMNKKVKNFCTNAGIKAGVSFICE